MGRVGLSLLVVAWELCACVCCMGIVWVLYRLCVGVVWVLCGRCVGVV